MQHTRIRSLCDDGANTLLEAKDTDILTPVERLFLWTEYKNPNPIETKKKIRRVYYEHLQCCHFCFHDGLHRR